jgi:hypothetical protein
VSTPDITFYCGLNETNWSHHPVAPGPLACIAPVYGRSKRTKTINTVSVPPDTQVLLDSGAFSDTTDTRLSFEQALFRQVSHAYRFGYVRQVTHLASYDCLIPDKGQPTPASEQAISETVEAARYLTAMRNAIAGIFMHRVGLVLTAQGCNAEQYLACAKQIVPMLTDNDMFGFGGFAATGLFPGKLLPPFKEVVRLVVPYLGSCGINRVHVWGTCYAPALRELLTLCKRYGIALSTDSSGPQRKPYLGQWGYSTWRDNSYKMPPLLESCKAINGKGQRAPTCAPGTRCRGLERARHVALTREWLAEFSQYELNGKSPSCKA